MLLSKSDLEFYVRLCSHAKLRAKLQKFSDICKFYSGNRFLKGKFLRLGAKNRLFFVSVYSFLLVLIYPCDRQRRK